jgi:pyrroline-5-carboxylate reductase
MKIALIGCGNMGQAILSTIISKGVSTPEHISVAELNQECREIIAGKFGVFTTDNSIDAIKRSDIVILAIKRRALKKLSSKSAANSAKGSW